MQSVRFIKIVLVFTLITISSLDLSAQNINNKNIKLTSFLSKLSEEHQVFFTYDVALIKEINVDINKLNNPDLQLIIDYLRGTTKLHFDNLGNNYYVIYNDSKKGRASLKIAKKRLKETIATISNSNSYQTLIISGKISNKNNEPLVEANIFENGSINGTTTDINGHFELQTNSFNNVSITISHIGYTTKVIPVKNNSELNIVLQLGEPLNEVQIVGSRNTNRSALDTPSAIDIIQLEEATSRTGQIEINQILQFIIPSFNASKQSGADGADHVVPATLRGLGPDQTLVLINGKRRHQSSLINLYGTRGRGNSGTDLNAIPASAIKRIEVLRDGASAQYGSDAIAGVLNVVLKDNTDTFNGNVTFGFNNAKPRGDFRNPTSGTDGNTVKVSGNYGMKILKDGFINITTEFLSKDNTLRPGASFREKYGEAGLNEYSIFLNTEIPINNNSSFYAFGGYSHRDSESYAFTRPADSPRNIVDIYPNGFNPLITVKVKDNSISAGFRAQFSGWNVDLNNTFGRNHFHYFIKETLNATLLSNSPTHFDAGGHTLNQNTTGVDFNRFYKHIFNGINIAFGTEYRIENYGIFAGEVGSYAAFDINNTIVDQNTPEEDIVVFNGFPRPRGSQGFPGYAPENEVNQTRSNSALYIDTEFDFTNKFMFGVAGRYEKYSDFGSTFNYKLATRFKANKNISLRSSFSSGFRAPSLAQIYYNLKFTNFIGSVPSESLLEQNNSPITRSFGIGPLFEEKAFNGNLGFTTKIKNFQAAIDAYYINVKDRIILTGNFDASNLELNVNDIQFFSNGVNTSTIGLDVILSWRKNIKHSSFLVSFAGNMNRMTIDKINNKTLDEETFFGKRDQFFLLASAPKNKFNLNLNYSHKKISTNLTLTRFSRVTLIDWQIYSPLIDEDPNSEFINQADRLSKATDIYNPKLTTDFNMSYAITDHVTSRFGATNLFNIYPTAQNNNWTDSGGYWDSVQMGSNGSFFYTNIIYKF
jgi:iron complex outermembrane receptor protein